MAIESKIRETKDRGGRIHRWWLEATIHGLKLWHDRQFNSGQWSGPFPDHGDILLEELAGSEALGEAIEEALALAGKRDEDWPQDNIIWHHRHAAGMKALASEAMQGTPVFARYGRLPKGCRSYNHRDGRYEAGVSVYPARLRKGVLYILLGGVDQASWLFIRSADVYVVRGDVIGRGADGEPLLANCKARRFRGEVKEVMTVSE